MFRGVIDDKGALAVAEIHRRVVVFAEEDEPRLAQGNVLELELESGVSLIDLIDERLDLGRGDNCCIRVTTMNDVPDSDQRVVAPLPVQHSFAASSESPM